jgi:hypothetical protein
LQWKRSDVVAFLRETAVAPGKKKRKADVLETKLVRAVSSLCEEKSAGRSSFEEL